MREKIIDIVSATQNFQKKRGEFASAFPVNTHVCHFFNSKEELLELMVPYFLEGLLMGDFCLWGVADPLSVATAAEALDKPLNGALQAYLMTGQIEIFDVTQLYGTGTFDAMAVKDSFLDKVASTRDKGWAGFRCDGMASGVSPRHWHNYQTYELEVTRNMKDSTTALCSYDATKLSGDEIAQVISTHQASITKRNGRWVAITPERV